MIILKITFGFRNKEKSENNGQNTNPSIQPKSTMTAHHVVHIGKSFDHQKHLQIGQPNGNPTQQRPHLTGVKLGRVQERNGTQTDGIGNHENGDAEQWQPVDVLHDVVQGGGVVDGVVFRVVVRVDGQTEDGKGGAHDQRGAAEQSATGKVLHGRDV